MKKVFNAVAMLVGPMLLVACSGTTPQLGGSSGQVVTGSASGEVAANQNTQLERCNEPMGTLAVYEDKNQDWWHYYYSQYPQLGSTVPVLRMMIQQSNCFVVVERGNSMDIIENERKLRDSGEMRAGSNFGKGQMVAADYTMNPSIQFSKQGTGGVGGAIGGLVPGVGGVVGLLAGGLSSNEAATTLLLVDNRSGVQVSASVGSAKNFDFNLFGGAFGGSGGGALGGFTNTPEGKVLTAAFADSYNQMVRSLRNYRAQTVQGGLGTGGKLNVQGGITNPSK